MAAAGVGIAQNTPSLLAYDSASRTWFTRIGTDCWLHSSRWSGPFITGKTPSGDALKAIADALPARHSQAAPAPAPAPADVPEVVVSTTPLCLVSIRGQPDLVQVADGIFAVRNANCDLFTAAADNSWWLLASGRWFTASDLMDGPWSVVKPASLPKAFAQIDPKGTWGNVLAAVPGTAAANDAIYQQSVPFVATLDRSLAKASVSTIGGAARFAPIAGTTVGYATNASAPLFQCDGAYYLCQDGAWFTAPAAGGPWTLCDSVPEAIYAIPPSCPVYGVTFVRVQTSTPDSVTFSFTAGYMNSFVADGVVAYGTGYATPGTQVPVDLGPGVA
jgi:hypothetical protein